MAQGEAIVRPSRTFLGGELGDQSKAQRESSKSTLDLGSESFRSRKSPLLRRESSRSAVDSGCGSFRSDRSKDWDINLQSTSTERIPSGSDLSEQKGIPQLSNTSEKTFQDFGTYAPTTHEGSNTIWEELPQEDKQQQEAVLHEQVVKNQQDVKSQQEVRHQKELHEQELKYLKELHQLQLQEVRYLQELRYQKELHEQELKHLKVLHEQQLQEVKYQQEVRHNKELQHKLENYSSKPKRKCVLM